MQDQKLENLLNLALDATPRERERSLVLDVGFEPEERRWDLIVKYSGSLQGALNPEIRAVELLGGFAILSVPESQIQGLTDYPQIEFIEMPKRLFFAVEQGRAASCINPVQSGFSPLGQPLFGAGVLVGCVDSGVDYAHPDFRNEDGSSRILRLWDQTVPGSPPQGYVIGTEYTKEQINEALRRPASSERYSVVPSRDLSGHGTGVLGIAAGSGRASGGLHRGVASESQIIVVKLGTPQEEGFPRTTELMQGVDYCIRQSIAMGMPLALNLSFGNNYGSHSGESLIEAYLDNVSSLGRTVICVGTGNEGNKAVHTSGILAQGESQVVPLQIGGYETGMNLQIWKQYVDRMDISLQHPNGQVAGPFQEILGPQRFNLGTTQILIYYGKPSPFSLSQEIFIDFIPQNTYVDSGVWKVNLIPGRIVDGRYNLWMPGGAALNEGTRFLFPVPEITLTIPSTAGRVISVGAYNSRYQAYADFSGRGFTRVTNMVKPDIAAPGVDITTASPNGGYTSRTGTSFATPFVTGSAALLMEWGIVRGNDPFLYGEKVKAYFRRGARHLLGGPYPNNQTGYGALCVRDSFPV